MRYTSECLFRFEAPPMKPALIFWPLLCCFLSLHPPVTEQAPRANLSILTWGGEGADRATDLALDAYGNVYITGLFAGTADLDPGPAVRIYTSSGENDLFLTKIAPAAAGEVEWTHVWGGSGPEKGAKVAVQASGIFYVVGSIAGKADLDPGDSVEFHQGHIFLAKYNTVGDFRWARTWGGSGTDGSFELSLDGSGSLL